MLLKRLDKTTFLTFLKKTMILLSYVFAFLMTVALILGAVDVLWALAPVLLFSIFFGFYHIVFKRK